MCFPHEMLGYERESLPGIMLSLECLQSASEAEEAFAKSNKGKSNARTKNARAAVRKPKKR